MLKQAKTLMDIATDTARFTTTIQIPMGLRQQIKNAGMTINGALIQGWAAMQERKTWNAEIARVEANLERYRTKMIEYRAELERLGQKVED